MVSTSAAAPSEASREASNVVTPEALRSLFLLDDDIVFLNHGSFGACPRPVWDVYMAWQRQLERQPVAFISRRSDALLQSAQSHLATYLNVQPDDLTFVMNATSGLNVIARSLPLCAGDEILTTDLEYGALDLTWRHLCAKAGATYRKANIPAPFTTPEAIVDTIWKEVNERTRAIFLSHITSGTSVILPVREICHRARGAGILTIVDGAHAPGQIPLDLAQLGVDVYAGNCHKWLCAPKGAAFLHVRLSIRIGSNHSRSVGDGDLGIPSSAATSSRAHGTSPRSFRYQGRSSFRPNTIGQRFGGVVTTGSRPCGFAFMRRLASRCSTPMLATGSARWRCSAFQPPTPPRLSDACCMSMG